MKTIKLYVSLFVFLFISAVSLYAQNVKYVAYFPVPYVSHQTINANSAFFAGKSDASVQVDGNLTANTISSIRDLEVKSTNTAGVASNVNVGTSALSNDREGSFVSEKQSGKITFAQVPTTSELKADQNLKVKTIKWQSNDINNPYIAFEKNSANTSTSLFLDRFPKETVKFCWSPLRLKGSYEYKYYLIAVPDCCPEEKAANGGSCPS